MANESLITATDNQVDLNNNDAELNKAGVRSDENGDKHSNGSTGAESAGKSPTDESDDLVLKLKKIILQQEQEEKAREQQRINEKQPNHPESIAGESSDKPQNGSKSPSLPIGEKVNESPKSVRSQLNGSRSPKTDKRSISQIKKSPVPSRKMINQTNSEINGKLANGRSANNEVNQPLVKETVQKIGDLAIDKVSSQNLQNASLNGNSNGNLINGCADANSQPVKVSINGRSISSSAASECSSSSEHSMSNESINNCVRHIVNQANELTKKELYGRSASKVESKVEPKAEPKVEPKCAVSKMEESNKTTDPVKLKSDKTSTNKSDQHESITIIQTKPVPNSKTAIKFDANNNVPCPDANNNLKEHSTAVSPSESTDEIDKQQAPVEAPTKAPTKAPAVKNKQLNGDDLPVDKVKQQEALPEIELIIRASNIDGKRKGADLFCQEYFMDLYLLAELKYIHLKISTVDLNKLTPSFRAKFDCTKPPILVVKSGNEQRAILENEKIERYIMKNVPGGHLLFVKDAETAKLIENLYSKFKLALSRNEPHTKQSLLKHLDAIDKHLAERKSKFITGDHVCCFDFELITKLQHIRIAGEYFIDEFEIPKNLANLWKYMNTMYHLNAFVEAAPDDQTIIAHYLNSNAVLVNRTSPAKNKNQTLQKPNLTISTPE